MTSKDDLFLNNFYQSFTHFRILGLKLTYHYLFLCDSSQSMARIIDQVNGLVKDSISSIHVVDKKNIFGSIWYFDKHLHTKDFFSKKSDVFFLSITHAMGELIYGVD